MKITSLVERLGSRARLMMLIAVATLPLGGLIACGLAQGVEDSLELARSNLRRTAVVAADGPATLFDNARSILEAARASPVVSVAGGDACDTAVMFLVSGDQQFMTMGVTDADGTIVCHSRKANGKTFSDPSLVDRALTVGAPDVVVGNFMIGKVTGKPTVAVAAALPPEHGGVAFVSMNLERLSEIAEGASDGGSLAVTTVQPSSGRMLTHFPPISLPFGTPLPEGGLLAAMRNHPNGGIVEAAGPDGVDRIYAFAPVHDPASGMMLAVGEERSEVIGPITRAAWAASLLGSFVLGIALLAAWWMGLITQIRPMERVIAFTRRLDNREYGASLTMEAWQSPEMRALSDALNATATRLNEARRADQRIAASESRFRLLAENTADLVTALDPDGTRTFASAASRDILGLEPEELVGRHPQEIACPEDRPIVDAMLASIRSGSPVAGVRYRMVHKDGHLVWVEVSGRPLEGRSGTVMSIRDVSQRRRMEEELEQANVTLSRLAMTDGLTGLLNRRAFDAALEREAARCRRETLPLSLILVDVDHFKAFNDTYGHQFGDDCLRSVASTIAGTVRHTDAVARYGGEEIVVVLPTMGSQDCQDRAQSIVAAVEALGIPHAASEHGVVTVSVGLATIDAGGDPRTLVERADEALYNAKASGRNRAQAWRSELVA